MNSIFKDFIENNDEISDLPNVDKHFIDNHLARVTLYFSELGQQEDVFLLDINFYLKDNFKKIFFDPQFYTDLGCDPDCEHSIELTNYSDINNVISEVVSTFNAWELKGDLPNIVKLTNQIKPMFDVFFDDTNKSKTEV